MGNKRTKVIKKTSILSVKAIPQRKIVNKIEEKQMVDIISDNNKITKDIIITISSYNRYDKLTRILDQLYSQSTKCSFSIVILNDGSDDARYANLKKNYPTINFINNKTNGGKLYYWKSINSLWELAKNKYQFEYLLQIDDDFILCDNFLNILYDDISRVRVSDNTYIAYSFHLNSKNDLEQPRWDCKYWIDGGGLYHIDFLKKIDFKIDEISKSRFNSKYISSGVWKQITKKINEFGFKILKSNYSLVKHDGNMDSKMNANLRKKKPINTFNYLK